MRHDPKMFSTEYLKLVWDCMCKEDGLHGNFLVEDGGHTVNGMFMDDVWLEMQQRGEGEYVAY